MDLNTFIVTVFCLIDDRMAGLGRPRSRGPTPTLFDSEVLTIEVVETRMTSFPYLLSSGEQVSIACVLEARTSRD